MGGGSRATATAHACTLTTAPPIGCVCFFHACWPGGTITPSTLVDSTGAHTWSFLSVADTGNVMRCMLGYALLTAVPTTVTLTLSATSTVAWTSSRYGGDNGGYPQRTHTTVTSANTGAGVASISANIPATSPASNRICVQTVGNSLQGVAITPAASWNIIDDQGNATANCRVNSAYRIISSSAVIPYGGSGSAASWGACTYEFDTSNIVDSSAGSIQSYRTIPVLTSSRY